MIKRFHFHKKTFFTSQNYESSITNVTVTNPLKLNQSINLNQSIYNGENEILLKDGSKLERIMPSFAAPPVPRINLATIMVHNPQYISSWNVDTETLKHCMGEFFPCDTVGCNGNAAHIGMITVCLNPSDMNYYLSFTGHCICTGVINGEFMLQQENGDLYIVCNNPWMATVAQCVKEKECNVIKDPYLVGYYHNLAMHEIVYDTNFNATLSDYDKVVYIVDKTESIMNSFGFCRNEANNDCNTQTAYNYIANDYTVETTANLLNSDLVYIRDNPSNFSIGQQEVGFINDAYQNIFVNIDLDTITAVEQVFDHINITAAEYLQNVGNVFDTTQGDGHIAQIFLSTAMHTAIFWDEVFALPGFVDSLSNELDTATSKKNQNQFQAIPAAALAFAGALCRADAAGAISGVMCYIAYENLLWDRPITKEGIYEAAVEGAIDFSGGYAAGKIISIASKIFH